MAESGEHQQPNPALYTPPTKGHLLYPAGFLLHSLILMYPSYKAIHSDMEKWPHLRETI